MKNKLALGKRELNTAQVTLRFRLIRTAISLLLGLAVAFLLILWVSDNPMRDMSNLLVGPLSNTHRIAVLVNMFVPLLFTGTAVSLMFSAGQINLAAEGAFFSGAVVGTCVALIPGIPFVLHFLLCALAAAISGAFFTGIPALMNAKFKVMTVVSSLMINYVALFAGLYIILNIVRDPTAGFEASYKFQKSAQLPVLIPGTTIHVGLIIGFLMVFLGWFIQYKTGFGYQYRTIGKNPRFAKFSGIPVASTLVAVQMLGGAIAGIGGATEVLSLYDRFSYGGLTNHGWDGIMMAVLARNNPKYIPLAALFLAYIRTSADVLNRTSQVPTEVVNIVQAVIIIFIAAERFLYGWEHRSIVKLSEQRLEAQNEQLQEQ
ncbi:MAG: ABC transporter permease [Eubacteriales bacterium]|nr:ABC transporter permease [Eubacteriales bacterium]